MDKVQSDRKSAHGFPVFFLPLAILLTVVTGCSDDGNPTSDQSSCEALGTCSLDALTPSLPLHDTLGEIHTPSEPIITISPVSGEFSPLIVAAPNQEGTFRVQWREHVVACNFADCPLEVIEQFPGRTVFLNPSNGILTAPQSFTGLLDDAMWFPRVVNQSTSDVAYSQIPLDWNGQAGLNPGIQVNRGSITEKGQVITGEILRLGSLNADDIEPLSNRPVLYDNGVALTPDEEHTWRQFFWPVQAGVDRFGIGVAHFEWKWIPLERQPFIKRTATWKQAMIGNSFVVSTGATNQSFTSTTTSGASVTSTTSFAESLTRSVGVGVEADFFSAAASVESEINRSFSTSLVVVQQSEETQTRNYPAGGVFRRWVLEETYEFVHEDGTPYTDPNYEFSSTFNTPLVVSATKDFIIDQNGQFLVNR